MGFGDPAASPCSSLLVAEEPQLWHLQRLHPLLLFLTLVSAELLLTLAAVFSAKLFSSLLKSVIPYVLPPLLTGSALASGLSVLELAGVGSVGHGESFWQTLRGATLVALPLLKSCPASSMHIWYHNWLNFIFPGVC